MELDLAGCQRVAEQLARAGALMVSLTGGDPFLRADLVELVSAIAHHHFPLLTTHGWLVTPKRAQALWDVGLAGASIVFHAADAVRHDERAGMSGAWSHALAALEAFAQARRDPGQRVNVKTSVRQSPESLESLLTLAAARGATVTVDSDFPLPSRDRAEAVLSAAQLLRIKSRHPGLRSSAHFLGRFDEAEQGGVGGCLSGKAFFNVDHRGSVSKCIEYSGPKHELGNLVTDGWDAVAPRLRQVPESNTCRACWYSSRGEVERLYSWRGLAAGLPEFLRA